MKFTIKRSKWLRGEGTSESMLYRPRDGKMCCMGQVCLRVGMDVPEISGVREMCYASGAKSVLPDFFREHSGDERSWVRAAYEVNDDPDLSNEKREAELKALALANGHEFEFVD